MTLTTPETPATRGPTRRRRLGDLYRRSFRESPRERLFLASMAFLVTFAVTRFITHAVRDGVGPFGNVLIRGQHVHHLVWGILLLLGVGYAGLLQIGSGSSGVAQRNGRIMATLYGIGAALTLDEFALWLNLRDVYWEREGRASIDAVILFGALFSVGLWGGRFARAVTRETLRVARVTWRLLPRRRR